MRFVSSAPEKRYFSFAKYSMKLSAMFKIDEFVPRYGSEIVSSRLPLGTPRLIISIPNEDVRWRIETSITHHPHELIKELQGVYVFTNLKEITGFLLKNNFLFEILFEAPEKIWKIFGMVPLYLEVHRDPEEGWDELFIVIKSSYNTDEALKLEDKLMEEWFLDAVKETKGKLNIVEEPL